MGEGAGSWDAVLPGGVGREAAVTRLLVLDGRGELSTAHVRLMASALGVSERTVWNWVSVARRECESAFRCHWGWQVVSQGVGEWVDVGWVGGW